MAHLDAFSAQIVKFVREMPDEALLDLVRQKVGVPENASPAKNVKNGNGNGAGRDAAHLAAAIRGSAERLNRKRPSPAARRTPPTAERQALLDSIERVVKSSPGVSASDVARLASVPQTRAAAALKELKLAQRIFQGGDRRFARYAVDLKAAEQASSVARKTAKGPAVARTRARSGRKRATEAE